MLTYQEALVRLDELVNFGRYDLNDLINLVREVPIMGTVDVRSHSQASKKTNM